MNKCPFCSIVSGEIKTAIVAESPNALIFRDIDPKAPVHYLAVPKTHYRDINDMRTEGALAVIGEILGLAAELSLKEKFAEKGYRVVCNNGPDAGQAVGHVHFHIMAGRLLAWPPG